MYLKIFDEVVSILHNDYAGCHDKKGWDNPDHHRNRLIHEQDMMNDEQFAALVQDYLLDFKDLHMHFKRSAASGQPVKDVGFTVRRYQDALYVTSAEKEERLKPGYRITALDGIPVTDAVKTHRRKLMETVAERENWEKILPLYTSVQVENDTGNVSTMKLKQYKKPEYQPDYYIKELNEDTLYMKLTDFQNHNAISALIKEFDSVLAESRELIIDVRLNKGGIDLAYYELLSYLFDGKEINLTSFENDSMVFNCSNRNVDLRRQMLEGIVSTVTDPSTKNQIDKMVIELENNRDKGFVELTGLEEEDQLIKTKPGPEQVVILSDVYCGSSGDSFVETCKNSAKVTVMGRPTKGVNDYANLAIMKWEDKFELWYPTSKLTRVDEGKGMSGVGIKPDIYIAWGPEHIHEDIDLIQALEYLKSKRATSKTEH